MKKLLFSLIFAFILSGCATPSETESPNGEFVMTLDQVNNYKQLLKDSLDKEQWTYDLDTATFEEGMIASKDDENYQKIYEASLDSGYDINGVAGQDCVSAGIPLYYLNGDPAGRAVFGIQNDKIALAYYLNMAGQPAGLANKDSYLVPLTIPKTADMPRRIFEQHTIALPNESPVILFNSETAEFFSFEGKIIKVYTFQDGSFVGKLSRDFPGDIIDIAFISDKLTAVLTLKEDFSKELFLCDASLNRLSLKELSQNYSAVQAHAGDLLLAAGGKLEVYDVEGNELILSGQKNFDSGIMDMEILPLGSDEMLAATDGVDTYLFSYEDAALLWRTHMPTGNSIESLRAADLDGDAVPELFVRDRQAAVRYIFTDEGLRAQSEIYTGNFILGDFNGDGKTDYVSGEVLYQ